MRKTSTGFSWYRDRSDGIDCLASGTQADDESNGANAWLNKLLRQQPETDRHRVQKFGRATTAISTRSMSARTPAARWNFARLAETVLTAIRFCIFWSRRMN